MITVQSETDPKKTYTIRQTEDGTFRCSCPAFVFREKCKHIAKYLADLKASRTAN